MSYVVAVVGATGVVGTEFLNVLEQRAFPVKRLRAMASARSVGETVSFRGEDVPVEDLAKADFKGVDLALFSAGGDRAKEHGPRAAAAGALVVDNSSAFRMEPDCPLVVPEVNGETALGHHGIIANPNCTTILLVVALAPLERHARIRRVVVSSYQAVSGSGAEGLEELERQEQEAREGRPLTTKTYPKPILGNVIPFVSGFGPGGLTIEEQKVVQETRRILGRPDLAVSATCVRVPVRRAHSEAANVELEREASPDDVRAWLRAAPGVKVVDDPDALAFPTPRDAEGGDDVLVGRVRRDPSHPKTIDLWLTGDQLRKGAALNAVQIAEQVLGSRRGALQTPSTRR